MHGMLCKKVTVRYVSNERNYSYYPKVFNTLPNELHLMKEILPNYYQAQPTDNQQT